MDWAPVEYAHCACAEHYATTSSKMAAILRIKSRFPFGWLVSIGKRQESFDLVRNQPLKFLCSVGAEDKKKIFLGSGDAQRKHTELEDSVDRKIFISKLGKFTDEATLQQYFRKYGEISELTIGRTKLTGRSRGFAFVRFKQLESVGRVLRDVHRVDGWLLDVKKAVPQSAHREKAKRAQYTQGRVSDERIIHVLCKSPNVTREQVREHFSQFGAVEKVVGLEAPTAKLNDLQKQNAERHCFVHFSSPEAANQALLLENQHLDSAELRVRQYIPNLAHVKETRKIVVKPVPHDSTVDDVKGYFEKFGKVQGVDLFFSLVDKTGELQGIAYVMFSDVEGAANAAHSLEHAIFGELVTVKKYAFSNPNKNRNQLAKVFVEGLPVDVSWKELKSFFSTFGRVKIVKHPLFQMTPEVKDCCTVAFSSVSEVEKLLRNPVLELRGNSLRVRRLHLQLDDVL